MEIREIKMSETKADMEKLQALAERCYMPAYAEIHTEEQNRYSFNEMYSTESLKWQTEVQKSRYFVVSDEGEDVGYVAIYKTGEGEWMLDKLYVLPEMKGKGCGGMLLRHVMKEIGNAEKGRHKVTLKVNRRNDAVGFYERHGFRKVDKWDIEIADGRWIMDGWTMEKEIKNFGPENEAEDIS